MLRTDSVAKLSCWFLVALRSEGLWQLMPGICLYCIDIVVFHNASQGFVMWLFRGSLILQGWTAVSFWGVHLTNKIRFLTVLPMVVIRLSADCSD